jgi:hypothetical protein
LKTIYVAGASKEVRLVQGYIHKLKEAGWKITEDWTLSVVENEGRELTEQERQHYAHADGFGVAEADWLWMLSPIALSVGCYVELGIALGQTYTRDRKDQMLALCPGRTIVISGPVFTNIFASHAAVNHRFEKHSEALSFLLDIKP